MNARADPSVSLLVRAALKLPSVSDIFWNEFTTYAHTPGGTQDMHIHSLMGTPAVLSARAYKAPLLEPPSSSPVALTMISVTPSALRSPTAATNPNITHYIRVLAHRPWHCGLCPTNVEETERRKRRKMAGLYAEYMHQLLIYSYPMYMHRS